MSAQTWSTCRPNFQLIVTVRLLEVQIYDDIVQLRNILLRAEYVTTQNTKLACRSAREHCSPTLASRNWQHTTSRTPCIRLAVAARLVGDDTGRGTICAYS